MKILAIALVLGSTISSASAVAQVLAAAPQQMSTADAGWQGQQNFGAGEYEKLEHLVADLIKNKTRTEDGRFALFMLTWRLEDWFELWDEDQDPMITAKFEEWRKLIPGSALLPLVAAMQVHATAWRARGRGFNSTVTDEGSNLFHERNMRAWKMLMEHKKESSAIPTWYQLAITVGADAGMPDKELRALFEEGIRRHPGYHPIYFAYARQLSPRWGGNYADADAFIREQTAAKANSEGETLYARLYWLIDQYGGGSPRFFEDSRVSWPTMRRGFQRLMRDYPRSPWNQANFTAFACRARDAGTYAILRSKVSLEQFKLAAPQGISIEVCDARFMKKT